VVPVDWLVGSGLDLSKVSTGLVFWPAPGHAGVSFEIDNVLWRSGTGDPTQTAEAFQGTGGAELNLDGLNGAANMSPDSYPGMSLAWSDEFDTNTLNEQLWSHDTGGWGWGNNESQHYRPENTTIQDGHLVITAKKELYSGREYTSSRIKTEGKQSFTYGRVDIRAALPRGQGIWPALWAIHDTEGEKFLTPDQFNRYYRYQSLLDAGATLSFGCDFPSHGGGLKAVAPLFNIEVGHTRQVAGQPDAAIQPSKQERLAVADLL
jgi:hypothetical protein